MLGRLKKRCTFQRTDVVLLRFLAAALVIGCVDAHGAGILIRYGCDVSFGIFFGGGCGSAWGSESGAAEKGLWPVCRLAEGSDFLSGSGVVSDFGQ